MVHTTPTTLLALAATATAYKHTLTDRMKCAVAVTQDAEYPTCTSPSKLDCFCAQPFDPSRVSSAAREVCEGVAIPTEYIPSFICRNHDRDGDSRDEFVHDHDHDHNCHHAVGYDDDDDSASNSNGDIISHPHRISHPMMRVSAPEADSSDAAKHTPNLQSKRAYAPQPTTGQFPSAAVTNGPSIPDSENEHGTHSAVRVITEVRTYTSCDCSSSTVAAATSARVHQSAIPVSSVPSAHVHQSAIPASSVSSAHVHQSAIPVSSVPSAHVHQSAMPLPLPVSSSAVSSMAGGHAHAQAHGPASVYVSVPVSVPTGVDALRSGYPSGRKTMASSFVVPSASASARPSHSPMTFDGGASVGVLVPSSVVMVGLTALMAFFM